MMIPLALSVRLGEGVPIWSGFERWMSGRSLLGITVSLNWLSCTASTWQSRRAEIGQKLPFKRGRHYLHIAGSSCENARGDRAFFGRIWKMAARSSSRNA